MDLLFNSFEAGELSPQMRGRSDLREYHQGCRTLEDFVVVPTGGAVRRPGFEHIDHAYSSSYASRLVGFVQGPNRYVLEFSQYKMRVFHDGALVTTGGADYTLTTPWTAAELSELVFAPRGQAIFHPDHDPYELTCAGDTSWTLTAFSSQYGPFLDANEDESLTITPSHTSGNSRTLTASADLFDAGHVGALFELTHQVDQVNLTGQFDNVATPPFTQNDTSSTVTIKGDYRISIKWRGWGSLKFQRSYDAGATWQTLYTWDKPMDTTVAPIEWAGTETEDNALFRFYLDWAVFGDPDVLWAAGLTPVLFWYFLPPRVQYSVRASHTTQVGIARVTAYTSPTEVTVNILNAFGSTAATETWREGAWSTYRGYPACGTIHDSRIYAAATDHQPTTVWSGRPFQRRTDGRVFYAGTDVTDEDAITRTVDAVDCHDIRWLASLWVMLAGSDGNLLKLVGASENSPLTPTDFNAVPQSGLGSAALQPIMLAGHILYAGRNAKRVYEMTYSDDARVYNPDDLTRYAEHVTGDGIAGWAFQQTPYPILWAWTTDGDLFAMTRDRARDLLAWHRHPLDATIESLAVIPGDGDDEVWASFQRKVNGATYRSIERMKPFGAYSGGTEQRDCFFVDGGTKWDGGAAIDVSAVSVAAGTGRVTVTAGSHGFTNGWTVRFADVAGMTDLNEHVYTVADVTANTFTLKTINGSGYIDGSGFTTYTSGGTVERVANGVTGLTHLAGESVAVLLDGQPGTGSVTTAGTYSIGTRDRHYHNTIIIGHAYTSKLVPMWPEIRTVAGSIQGRKKKLTYCGVRLYLSAGGKLGSSADDAEPIDYSVPGEAANADKVLVTEDKVQDHPGGWTDHGDLYLETDSPLPMTVTAILFGME